MLVYKGELRPEERGPTACGRMCETTRPDEQGYRFFGIVDGRQCHCGHKVPPAEDRREEVECRPCASETRDTCGAQRLQSVYQACLMPRSAWVSEGHYLGGAQITADLAFERGYCKAFAREGGWGLEHPGDARASHIWQTCEPRTIDPAHQVCTKMATLWTDLFDTSIGLTFGYHHLWVLCKLYKVVFCQKCSLKPKPAGCENKKTSLKSCTAKKRAVCQWTCEMYHKDVVAMSSTAMQQCEASGGVVRRLMGGRSGCCFEGCITPTTWKNVPTNHQWCTPHLQTL